MPRHIRKNDLVMVTNGGGRSSSVGKVLRVIVGKTANQNRVVVEGVNICKKHMKPNQQNPQGGIIEKEMPVHISNVMPVVDGKSTRVCFQTRDDGSKVRLAATSGHQIGPGLRKGRG